MGSSLQRGLLYVGVGIAIGVSVGTGIALGILFMVVAIGQQTSR